MSSRDGTNYYELLEIPADAHSTEIHKAYQRAKQTYSQDNPALYSMFSQEEARELLRLIEEAFTVLNNPSLRKDYDVSLSSSGGPPPAARPQNASRPANKAAPAPTPAAPTAQEPQQFAQPAATSSYAMQTEAITASDTYKVKPNPAKPAAPAGSGRTTLSNYKIDASFEAEINATEEFDGALLQRIRLYKNISLEKMSEATRISRSYLSAVESSDYKSLPAAVFVRGFVVQIARQLGIDEQKAATTYIKAFKAAGGK